MSTPYVATFYSFKGGVGRSTLLVNVAYALAARGERVLIWDLDLEAPGIHHFPGLEPPEQPWQGGFLEWLGETPAGGDAEPSPDWPAAPWMRALTDRVYAPPSPAGGKLFVLPAHGTGADLGKLYARVDWHHLFVERPWHGLHLFKQVRDALIARFDPTFLFIDARTGITDLGGMLTGYLPDCTVLIGNYSAQSTHGLRSVFVALDRFADRRRLGDARRERPLERVLVASPVPTSPALLERGRARWAEGFPGVAPRSLVEVPLVESLLYAEDMLVRSAPSSNAAHAYTRVAEQLAGLRDAGEPVPVRAASETSVDDRGSLETRVAELMQLLGFEVDTVEDGGMFARDRRPLGGSAFALTCAPGAARVNPAWRARFAAAKKRGELSRREPLLVAERVGDEAKAAARSAGVELRALGELEAQLVDLAAYRAAICRDFERGGLARGYVGQRFVGRSGEARDALATTLEWLVSAGPRLMLVAGAGGSGKSSFLHRLAYELATRVADDDQVPTPLLIDLLEVAGVSSLESVVQDHLRRTIGWHGNPDAILYLLRVGRVVLLFDGFDELSTTSSELGAEELLRVLARPTLHPGAGPAANRVIVSCRQSFPRGDEDAAPAGVAGLAARLHAVVRELAPFDDEQIGQFLRNKLGRARGGAVLESLAPRGPMAQTPLTLELLSGNDDLLQQHGEISASRLYDQMAHDWISVRKESPLHAWQRKGLILRLAGELWRLPEHELHHATFASQILTTERELLGDLDASHLDGELRTAPFLVRSRDGAYRFARREFLEYFMARHLLKCAGDGVHELTAALATERLTASCAALFAERVEQSDAETSQKVVATLESVAGGKVAADVKDNAERLLRARAERRGELA